MYNTWLPIEKVGRTDEATFDEFKVLQNQNESEIGKKGSDTLYALVNILHNINNIWAISITEEVKEEIHFENRQNRNFCGPVTLTLTADDFETYIVGLVSLSPLE